MLVNSLLLDPRETLRPLFLNLDDESGGLEEEIRREGGVAKYYHMDVSKESEVRGYCPDRYGFW
jgi:hypothetical protein